MQELLHGEVDQVVEGRINQAWRGRSGGGRKEEGKAYQCDLVLHRGLSYMPGERQRVGCAVGTKAVTHMPPLPNLGRELVTHIFYRADTHVARPGRGPRRP